MLQKAKEPQNQVQFDNYLKKSGQLGPYTTHIWNTDPRHLCFLLARYKFVSKMLEGKQRVLEVGVGDAFGIPVIAQTVTQIHAIDWEPLLLEDNIKRLSDVNCTFECLDITLSGPEGIYDAGYSLDVIEHIPTEKEEAYFKNICSSLSSDGVFILGTPNVSAAKYASEASKEGHINLKSHHQIRALMLKYFSNVFMFSMNDEMVHTGYEKMAHYLFGMGVGVREPAKNSN